MARQVRIETFSEVYIKEELEDNSKPAKLYEVVEETVDREGNYEYYLQELDNDEAEAIGPYYPESLVDAEEAQHPDSGFPSFKSYGLTREQVWEVVMLFMEQMTELHKDLAEEAFADRNYEYCAGYHKDCQKFLAIKLMEDQLWHRFVEGN